METDARRFRLAIDSLAPSPYSGIVYRHFAPSFDVLSGQGAFVQGGRWNPPNSYGVTYTGLDIATVDREFVRAVRLGAISPARRRLATIEVSLSRVLDLTQESVRQVLGVTVADITRDDLAIPQAIGEAAHHLGFEAILAPAAAGGTVLAIFAGNRVASSVVEVAAITDYIPAGL